MFGYKLKLVKKDEVSDVIIFKSAVNHIRDLITDFQEFIFSGLDLDRETVQKLTGFNDDLGIYIDIYFNNKYSLPSNSLVMYQHMDNIRKCSLVIIDAITEYNKLQSMEKQFRDRFGEDEDPYTYSDRMAIASEIQRGYRQVNETLGKASISIINSLLMLSTSIRGDATRIEMGIDFVKDYKRRQKMKIKNETLDSEFQIKYVLNARSDKEYLLKEKVKNERSRTRTSDGRSEKTV